VYVHGDCCQMILMLHVVRKPGIYVVIIRFIIVSRKHLLHNTLLAITISVLHGVEPVHETGLLAGGGIVVT
jgi:hypothetical protein